MGFPGFNILQDFGFSGVGVVFVREKRFGNVWWFGAVGRLSGVHVIVQSVTRAGWSAGDGNSFFIAAVNDEFGSLLLFG